jgi:hypothetical protein
MFRLNNLNRRIFHRTNLPRLNDHLYILYKEAFHYLLIKLLQHIHLTPLKHSNRNLHTQIALTHRPHNRLRAPRPNHLPRLTENHRGILISVFWCEIFGTISNVTSRHYNLAESDWYISESLLNVYQLYKASSRSHSMPRRPIGNFSSMQVFSQLFRIPLLRFQMAKLIRTGKCLQRTSGPPRSRRHQIRKRLPHPR